MIASVSPRPAVLAAAAFLVALGAACSSTSNSVGGQCSGTTSTFDVSVIDDSNEAVHVCDATVTISGPDGTVTLKPQGAASNCTYVGNVSTSGMYTLTAVAPGYGTMMIPETVTAGCPYSLPIDVMATP
jgi:hypothetical protein